MSLTAEDRPILDRLAADGEVLVARAMDWAHIPSGSRNLPGLRRQLGALADAFAVLPAAPEQIALQPAVEIDADGRALAFEPPPALAVTVRPEAPVQVVLTGHYDTVYPESSPFTAVREREDGALNGPGIADMKGGLSVMLAALQAFEDHPASRNLGYRVLISPDEETGSLASAPELARIGALGQVGLTYEPALSDGAMAGARKGSGNFHVLVKGRAAHAGRAFHEGRNAIAAAARLAAELDALNGRRDGVTLNVARIDGGGPSNVVPDTAILRFNVRFPDAEAAAWIEASIDAAIAARAADDVSLHRHGGLTRPAKPMNGAQRRLFEAVRQAGEALGQPVRCSPSGGVCEGNNLFAAGLPNIDTLGVRGGDIHSEAEFAWPESFAERAQLSALLLIRLARGEIDAAAIRAAMSEA